MRIAIAAALTLLAASPLLAQHEHHESPYAGTASAGIPSLTDEEIRELETGAGMGLARAAELNHHPGPMHVLELAEALELSADQRERIAEIERAMRAEAIEVGHELLEAERRLNDRFRHGHIDRASLEAATEEIARIHGRLRFVHLNAHLETTRLLDEGQVEAYDRLRGYAPGAP